MNDIPAQTRRTLRFDRAIPHDPGARTTTRVFHANPAGSFKTGFWSAEPGSSPIAYTMDEMCVLLEGHVRLTDASGHVEEYVAGDTFLIPNGFTGTWETVKHVKKFFAIYKPA